MRVNPVNNNQHQQNFGFKVKSVHIKSADGTKVLPINDEAAKKLLFFYGDTDGFIAKTLDQAKKIVLNALERLKHGNVKEFFFRGTPEQPRVEDVLFRHVQFAVKKDGEDYTLVTYKRKMLDSEDRKTLKIEAWGVNPEESEFLTTTEIVEIESENQQELAELQQMHKQLADSLSPFRKRFKYVFEKDFDENLQIDGRVV